MLTVIDEYSRECLAIHVERRQNQEMVLETLANLFLLYRPPDYIRTDNVAEFAATAVREWLQRLDVQTLFIEPGSPSRHSRRGTTDIRSGGAVALG
jgi:transposase InsO family protein